MRVGTYSLGILLALGASGLGFAACGSTVAVTATAAGTGGSGTGGASNTTVVVSSSTGDPTSTNDATGVTTGTGTGGSMSSSTGAGGGDQACTQACDHIQMCTGFTCAQGGINCTTMGSQYDCEFNCAAQTPCAQLGIGTIQGCQAQCADGGVGPTDGGANDGGMMGASCQQCAIQKCQSESFACGTNPTCQGWLGCLNTCNMAQPPDPTCPDKCDAMFVGAKPLYDPLYACTCTNCATACAANDPCNHGGADAGDGG